MGISKNWVELGFVSAKQFRRQVRRPTDRGPRIIHASERATSNR